MKIFQLTPLSVSIILIQNSTRINQTSNVTHTGKLRINGNPDKDTGDITLSLRERGAPVEIKPGTKDLVLAIALDKEGVDGPSSVYVNVICDRRHSTDPVSLSVYLSIYVVIQKKKSTKHHKFLQCFPNTEFCDTGKCSCNRCQ